MKKTIGFIFLSALAYAIGWTWYAFPYTLVSADDLTLVRKMGFAYYPAFKAWVSLFSVFETAWGWPVNSAILLQAIAANTLSLMLVGWLCFRLMGTFTSSAAAVLLFGISTWPAVYFFDAARAPLAALLSLAVIVCLVEAYLEEKRTPFFLILGGCLASLQLMTSLFLVPLVVLQLVVVFLLFTSVENLERWKAFGFYLVPFFIGLGAFLFTHGEGLLEYIRSSFAIAQFSGALSEQGDLPQFPFASLYFMGNFYGPGLFYGTMGLALLFLFFFFDLKRHRTTQEKLLFLFASILIIHPFVIDLSPVPAAASAHFPIYPMFVLLFVAFSAFWIRKATKSKPLIIISLGALFVWTGVLNFKHDQDLVRVKQNASAALEAFKTKKLVAFATDIHADSLEEWLGIELSRVTDLQEVTPETADGILVGPHGQGSGHSVLADVAMRDFSLLVERPEGMKKLTVPFFGYYPAFVFESPISAARYFADQMPKYDEPTLQVELWYWPPAS